MQVLTAAAAQKVSILDLDILNTFGWSVRGSLPWPLDRRRVNCEECTRVCISDFTVRDVVFPPGRGPGPRVIPLEGRFGAETVRWAVQVTATAPHYGGVRLWWLCPLCRRRCRMLYAPPGSTVLACRFCHGLNYASQRNSRKPTAFQCLIAARAGCSPAQVERLTRPPA